MKYFTLFILLCLSVNAQKKPNILLIIADNLGYSDLSFGAKGKALIPTPSTDRLAKEGVMLNRF